MSGDRIHRLPPDVRAVLEHVWPKLTAAGRRVYLPLRDYADRDGYAWPGMAILADDADTSERTIQQGVQDLLAHGVIEQVEAGGGRGRRPVWRFKTMKKSTGFIGGETPKKSAPFTGENPEETCAKTPKKSARPPYKHQDMKHQYDGCAVGERFIFKTRSGDWALEADRFGRYRQTYGDRLDVERELAKAQTWCEDNPGQRKTAKGMPSFLTRWLNRADEQAHCNGHTTTTTYSTPQQVFEAIQAGKVSEAVLADGSVVDLTAATAFSERGLKANGQLVLGVDDLRKAELQ